MSPLYWGAQNWTQFSTCGLTNAKESERITSLDLLATLLNLSTRTPRASSAKLLSSRQPQACTGAWDCSSPGARSVLPFVELHELLVSPFLQPVEVPVNGSIIL